MAKVSRPGGGAEETDALPGIFGSLAGTVTVHGDIIAPTGESWNADG